MSHADFEGACKRLQIKADFSSVLHAIRALDSDQKGYLDFRTFAKKLTPGVSERIASMDPLRDGDDIRFPEVGPSKSRLSSNIK